MTSLEHNWIFLATPDSFSSLMAERLALHVSKVRSNERNTNSSVIGATTRSRKAARSQGLLHSALGSESCTLKGPRKRSAVSSSGSTRAGSSPSVLSPSLLRKAGSSCTAGTTGWPMSTCSHHTTPQCCLSRMREAPAGSASLSHTTSRAKAGRGDVSASSSFEGACLSPKNQPHWYPSNAAVHQSADEAVPNGRWVVPLLLWLPNVQYRYVSG